MKQKNQDFWDSAKINNSTYNMYYNRLTELALSMFEWKNLPDSVDERFLELCLLRDGMCVYFEDEVLGELALRTMIGGRLNVYQIPTDRTAYASNGYNKKLTDKDSVIIFNNMLHTNSQLEIELFARRLWDIDRTIEINTKAQKTPMLITCEESQRLTLKNTYMKYDGNMPVIFADKNLNPNALKTIQTGAPFISDKLYVLKTQIWNEALTFFGISNINVEKKERLISDEVTRNQGGTIASRFSKLNARRQAAKMINQMFPNRNIEVDFRQDFRDIDQHQILDETMNESGIEIKEVKSDG